MKVSLFMFVKEPAPRRAQAFFSMTHQTHADIEIIVVDGDKEPDDGPNDALRKALNRCTGEIVGSCLADERLNLDAAKIANGYFTQHPEWAAITGDALITDERGRRIGFHQGEPFDLKAYLCCDQTPYFCSSFFRRAALPPLDPESDSIEFDIWHHLGTHFHVQYIPYTFASYASHADQSSNNPTHMLNHLRGRLQRLREMSHLTPDERQNCIDGHRRAFKHHAEVHGLMETALAMDSL